MKKHGFFQITQKLFLRDGDKLLIFRDKKSGYGDLPGGRMDEDEFFGDWLDSLYREIQEEMGNNFQYRLLEKEPFLIHKHRIADGNYPCILLGYRGVFLGGEIQMSDEHDFMDWVNVKTYNPSELFEEYMLEAVEIYLKKYA